MNVNHYGFPSKVIVAQKPFFGNGLRVDGCVIPVQLIPTA